MRKILYSLLGRLDRVIGYKRVSEKEKKALRVSVSFQKQKQVINGIRPGALYCKRREMKLHIRKWVII